MEQWRLLNFPTAGYVNMWILYRLALNISLPTAQNLQFHSVQFDCLRASTVPLG